LDREIQVRDLSRRTSNSIHAVLFDFHNTAAPGLSLEAALAGRRLSAADKDWFSCGGAVPKNQ
jgi:hypothetical protein